MEIYEKPVLKRVDSENLGGRIIAGSKTKTVAQVFNGMARVMKCWSKEGAMREYLEKVAEHLRPRAAEMFYEMADVLREKDAKEDEASLIGGDPGLPNPGTDIPVG